MRLEVATGVAESAVRMIREGSTVWKSAGTWAVSHAGASDFSRIQATCLCRICSIVSTVTLHVGAVNDWKPYLLPYLSTSDTDTVLEVPDTVPEISDTLHAVPEKGRNKLLIKAQKQALVP